MTVSAVTAPTPLKPPDTGEPRPPAVTPDDEATRTPQPTLLVALPPGQGTRVDQLA